MVGVQTAQQTKVGEPSTAKVGVLDKQECLGALPGGKTEMRKQPSIDVVRLVEEIEAAPAAGVPVAKKRFRMDPLRPELWPKR